MKLKSLLLAILLCLPLGTNASERELRNSIVLGALAFADNCRKCHETDGYGKEGLYPSLHRSSLLADRELLIKTILHGRVNQRSNSSELRLMPAFDYLTNHEIAAIIAFVTSSWGEEVILVTGEEIEAVR